MRTIPGMGLLLVGSGLYWILSSRLISSFTVLSPGLFQSTIEQNVIMAVGIVSAAAGLWIIDCDLEMVCRLAKSRHGYIFVLPISLVALDVYSTMINLYLNSQAIELNPFVASAIQYGAVAMLPFLLSYIALSQGVALLMLSVGRALFGESFSTRFLPFALVCGVSSFGPFSNMLGMAVGFGTIGYVLGGIGSAMIGTFVYRSLRNITALRPFMLD